MLSGDATPSPPPGLRPFGDFQPAPHRRPRQAPLEPGRDLQQFVELDQFTRAIEADLDHDIPSVDLPGGAGKLRVIAGEYAGERGPAQTFTPIDVWDVRLDRNGAALFTPPEGHTVAVVVLKGMVQVNGAAVAREAQFVLLDRKGGEIRLEANSDASLLILGGEPIEEPVVMHGPFVMNTVDEIRQAMVDFHGGKFGDIAA